MANKRMFSRAITESDAFRDLPLSAQALYLHLNQSADDEGFVSSPQSIRRAVGASNDDLQALIDSKFLLKFESGIVIVKHWLIHNTIRKDRFKSSTYFKEMGLLSIEENGAYTFGCQNDNQVTTKWQPSDNPDKNKNKISIEQEQEQDYYKGNGNQMTTKSIIDVLTDDDINSLYEIFAHNGTDLLDFLDAETLGADVSIIKKPLAYARTILNESGWEKR